MDAKERCVEEIGIQRSGKGDIEIIFIGCQRMIGPGKITLRVSKGSKQNVSSQIKKISSFEFLYLQQMI